MLAAIENGEKPDFTVANNANLLDKHFAEQGKIYCRDCFTVKDAALLDGDSCQDCAQDLAAAIANFTRVNPADTVDTTPIVTPRAVPVEAPIRYRDTILPGVLRAENEHLLSSGKKRCAWCGELKSRDEYANRKTGSWDGKLSFCSDCAKAAVYRWRAVNKKRMNHGDKLNLRKKQAEDPLMRRLKEGARRAKRNGRFIERFKSKQLLEYWESIGIDPWTCYYCGCHITNGKRLHLDHLLPLTRGGDHTKANLVPACMFDNLTKHDRTPDEYTEYLTTHSRATRNELLQKSLGRGLGKARANGLPADTISAREMRRYWIFNGIDPDSCYWCVDGDAEHLDHLYPLARPDSPGHVLSNLVPSCAGCNHQKCDRTPAEYIQLLAEINQIVNHCEVTTRAEKVRRKEELIIQFLQGKPAGAPRSDCVSRGKSDRDIGKEAVDALLAQGIVVEVPAPATKDSSTGVQGITMTRGKYRVSVGKKYVGIYATLDEAKSAHTTASHRFDAKPVRVWLTLTKSARRVA